MAFDPDKFLAETAQAGTQQQAAQGFDPDKFLMETAQASEQEVAANSSGQQFQAGVEALGQGASFGYLPQIQAGAEMLMDKLTPESDIDKELKEKGFKIQEKDPSYTELRDANIARHQSQKERFPGTTTAAEVAGGLGTAIATAGLGPQIKGAQFLGKAGKLAQAAKSGAIYSAIQNPGDSEGKIGGVQVIDRLENALSGALTGAAFSGGAEVLGKAAKNFKKIPALLRSGAGEEAISAAGGERGSLKKVFRANRINIKKAGQDLLKKQDALGGKAVIELGDDIDKIAGKITKMERSIGDKIGSITDRTDEVLTQIKMQNLSPQHQRALKKSTINMKDFAEVMKRELKKESRGVDKRTSFNRLSKALDELASEGDDISLSKLRELRKSVDDKISWNKSNSELAPVDRGFKMIRDKMQDLTKQKIRVADEISGTNMLPDFRAANRDYGQYKTLSEFAQNKLAASKGNRFFSMSEMGAGGAGSVIGGPVGFILGVAGSRAVKKWGGAAGARALKRTAEILQKDPTRLEKFTAMLTDAYNKDPESLIGLIIELQQGNPEYRELIKPRKGN